MHLVDFTIEIFDEARSYKRQITLHSFNKNNLIMVSCKPKHVAKYKVKPDFYRAFFGLDYSCFCSRTKDS